MGYGVRVVRMRNVILTSTVNIYSWCNGIILKMAPQTLLIFFLPLIIMDTFLSQEITTLKNKYKKWNDSRKNALLISVVLGFILTFMAMFYFPNLLKWEWGTATILSLIFFYILEHLIERFYVSRRFQPLAIYEKLSIMIFDMAESIETKNVIKMKQHAKILKRFLDNNYEIEDSIYESEFISYSFIRNLKNLCDKILSNKEENIKESLKGMEHNNLESITRQILHTKYINHAISGMMINTYENLELEKIPLTVKISGKFSYMKSLSSKYSFIIILCVVVAGFVMGYLSIREVFIGVVSSAMVKFLL